MQDIDRLATERIRKARAEFILSQTFYGVLVSNVVPVVSREVPTAATNGKQHFWNPDFIGTLSPKELLAVQAHESEHDARRHNTRRGGRDPVEWNISCDYAINIDLVDAGYTLPEKAYVDPKYRGMSAEDIYRTRELDRQKEAEEKQKGESPEADDGDDEAEGEEGDGEEAGTDDAEGDDDGQGGQGEGDDDGEEAEGDGPGQGDDGEEPGNGQGAGEAKDGGNEPGTGSGSGPAEDGTGDAPTGSGEASSPDEGPADADGPPVPGKTSGDCGGMGEVLDAADDAAELGAEDSKWETIMRQAASLAAKRGDAPGHVTREIKRADAPGQDWREVLRAWIDTGSKSIETWARPNRRFAGSGLYLPGRQRDGLNKVVFVIDTSGSMDAIALKCINTEAQAALDDGAIDEAVVVYGDTQVNRVDTYRQGDEIEFDPRGGGGTDLKPLFQHVEDEIDSPSLMVVFSDMEIGDPGPEPSCPVLFAATGYPDRVREYLADAPWGAPGIDVGSH